MMLRWLEKYFRNQFKTTCTYSLLWSINHFQDQHMLHTLSLWKFFGCKILTEPVRKSLSNYFCDTSNLINASTFLVQSDDNSYDSSLCDFKKGSLFPFLICNYFELNTCLHLIVRWWCFFFVPCRISFWIIDINDHNYFAKSQPFWFIALQVAKICYEGKWT